MRDAVIDINLIFHIFIKNSSILVTLFDMYLPAAKRTGFEIIDKNHLLVYKKRLEYNGGNAQSGWRGFLRIIPGGE